MNETFGHLVWATAVAVVLLGCAMEDPSELHFEPFDPVSFIVQGRAEIRSLPATDVVVTARCNGRSFGAVTDHDGRYQMETDVVACDRLIVEWNKESYLPQSRIIALPAFTRTLDLSVELEELEEIQCGNVKCETDFATFPGEHISWGWAASGSGARDIELLPGELKEPGGNLISMIGFSFFDFKDDTGTQIQEMPPWAMCSEITGESYDWLGDADLDTPRVDLNWYRYDAVRGIWQKAEQPAFLAYTLGKAYEDCR